MPTIQPPASGRTSSKPPASNYPQLDSLKLPRPLTQAITQSFQVAYAVRDQATANSDAINRISQYGNWQERTNTDPTSLPDGALWFHTDYHNAVYQVRVDKKMNQLAWFYATGVIWTGSAIDPQKLGLGPNDIGLMAAATGHLYVWDGTQLVTLI